MDICRLEVEKNATRKLAFFPPKLLRGPSATEPIPRAEAGSVWLNG
jgi:hypothetical protein